jgi:hypothetical protein
MASVNYGNIAVSYKNLDPILKVSDNIGYIAWFNINNYLQGEVYNLFNFYDNTNLLGWKVNLLNDSITVTLNSATYSFDLNTTFDSTALDEEVWYCYVLNLDQRNRKMEQFIYKRNVEDEDDAAQLPNTFLKSVYYNTQDIDIIEYQLDTNTYYPVIYGSDMKLTNIRLFSEIIPVETHNKILNQYIIRDDSKYLVFADNATTRLYLPRFPLFE